MRWHRSETRFGGGVESISLPTDVLWGSFVTHSFNMSIGSLCYLFECNHTQFFCSCANNYPKFLLVSSPFPLISSPQLTLQILTSKFKFPFVIPIHFNRSSGENLLKYELDSSSVIMSLILMTTLFYKAVILQGEIWYSSLVGLFNYLKTKICIRLLFWNAF